MGFVPPNLESDSNELRRARLVLYFSLVIALCPGDVALDQRPTQGSLGERTIGLRFIPIGGEEPDRIMVVATDVTEEARAAASEARQREQMEAFRWISKDEPFFVAALSEAKQRLASVLDPSIAASQRRRELHTLKGNLGLLGFRRFASYCHEVESRSSGSTAATISPEDRADDPAQVLITVRTWTWVPTSVYLNRLARQARALAERGSSNCRCGERATA